MVLTRSWFSNVPVMALPILTGVFRCAITHGGPEHQGSTNVIHVLSNSLTPIQVVTALNGAAAPNIFMPMHTGATPVSVVVTKLDGASPTAEGALDNPNWLGTSSADTEPGVAVVVTLKTDARGKRNTGRVFIGPVGEDQVANGFLIPATATGMQTAWTTFIANLTSAGIPLQVASYGYNPIPPDPERPSFAAANHPVQFATVQPVLGSQRRRQQRLRG